MDYVTIAKIRS